MVSMFLVTLLVFFYPEIYELVRLHKEMSPFMAYVLSIGVFSIYGTLKRLFSRPRAFKLMSVIYVAIILIVIMPSLTYPVYVKYYYVPRIRMGLKTNSVMADYEYEAALWLRDHTPQTSRIMSDYKTMLFLTPLSNKIWLTSKQMHGSIATTYHQTLWLIKYKVFRAADAETAYRTIQALTSVVPWEERYYLEYSGINPENLTFIVILSSRTVRWIEQENLDDVHSPEYSNVSSEYLEVFNDTRYFKLIYSVDEKLFVFEVKERTE